jgi:ADP-ribose pyrophosphatase YjhB (NUDIX family)
MRYCSNCGAPLEVRIPEGDDRHRHTCPACGAVHYQNPKLVVGCLPEWGDRILLCRRGIEPRYGLWTLPAGYMENDETVEEAALRETLEEANARVEIVSLFSLVSLPHINQVYMLFRGRLLDLDFSAGQETLEARLFSERQIPWDELAFSSIRRTLELYFRDREAGCYGTHTGTIRVPPQG